MVTPPRPDRPGAPGVMMPTAAVTPAVRRIDHIIIRIGDERYDDFYALFAETLRLPTPWPPTDHPTLRSGGVYAGNVDFELLYVPGSHLRDQAQLYGVVFEAWASDPGEFARRGLPYLPVPYIQTDPGKPPATLWMNYFLPGLIGSSLWQRALFGLKRIIPNRLWLRSAAQSGENAKAVQFIFNAVYRSGVVFGVKYNPIWRDIDAERRISAAQLEMRAGGVLGLVRVKEVVVGTTQLTQTSSIWRKLLRPAIEETGLCWQVGDGPALRVIAAERDGLHHMVWEVASLADAQAALEDLGLLGAVLADEITLDPVQCYGLDIRLVEAPGGFSGW